MVDQGKAQKHAVLVFPSQLARKLDMTLKEAIRGISYKIPSKPIHSSNGPSTRQVAFSIPGLARDSVFATALHVRAQ